MKEKSNPESKLNLTLKNTNKKRDVVIEDPEEGKEGASPLKKNEYAFIFLGAALLSIVIVFIFFRPSEKQAVVSTLPAPDAVQVFETRIAHIENILAKQLGSGAELSEGAGESDPATDSNATIESYQQRVERVETAFSVKFDSLAERLDRLEKQIALLSRKAAAPVVQEKQPANKTVTPLKTAAVTKSKPAAKGPEPMLHTVEKGETLYSISKKYKTTVAQLRKLNKLSEKDDIYPGNNILVR